MLDFVHTVVGDGNFVEARVMMNYEGLTRLREVIETIFAQMREEAGVDTSVADAPPPPAPVEDVDEEMVAPV